MTTTICKLELKVEVHLNEPNKKPTSKPNEQNLAPTSKPNEQNLAFSNQPVKLQIKPNEKN